MKTLLLVATLALGACLESQGQALHLSAADLCAYNVRCGLIGASEEDACRDEGEPRGRLPVLDGRDFAPETAAYSTREAVRAGRLVIDRDAERRCLEALDDPTTCDVLPCARVYVGAVPGGGACRDNRECFESGICQVGVGDFGPIGAEPGQLGTCVARAREGEACDPQASPCALGLTCDAGQCAPLVLPQRGEACGGPALTPPCAADLTCRNGVCAPRGAAGEPCTVPSIGGLGGLGALGVGGPCAAGLFCDDGACAPLRTDGEACAIDAPCAAGRACVGLVVDTTEGTCGPWLDVGAACADGAHVSGCPADMRCVAGTCEL